MFEKRSKKQRTIIYIIIAIIAACVLAFIHFLQGWSDIAIFVAAVIEFFCIFYILYLPLKIKG